MEQRTQHKILFTLSHYTEKVLENLNKKNISNFDQFMINSLQIACDQTTSFEVFSKLTSNLINESQSKKEAREWIERIIKLYDLIKGLNYNIL